MRGELAQGVSQAAGNRVRWRLGEDGGDSGRLSGRAADPQLRQGASSGLQETGQIGGAADDGPHRQMAEDTRGSGEWLP